MNDFTILYVRDHHPLKYMVCDLRNLQTTNDVPDVTNIPFWVLQVKNEVAAKIVRVYMPMLWAIPGRTPI